MLIVTDINKELLQNIINQYKPKWIIDLSRYEVYKLDTDKLVRTEDVEVHIHSDLALL